MASCETEVIDVDSMHCFLVSLIGLEVGEYGY